MKVLITGSSGLVGTALTELLTLAGIEVVGLDIVDRGNNFLGDVSNTQVLEKSLKDCNGIVHLAAVSRVVHAQNDPAKCWAINVNGTKNLLKSALNSPLKPWVIFASSREVYGQQTTLPVKEDAGLKPMNIYGSTKVAGEMQCHYARSLGLKTAVVRFSNIYGGKNDHHDRVIPAFINAAMGNNDLRIEGGENTFDFTHVADVVRGLLNLIELINLPESKNLPPIHFVRGSGTTLEELAEMIINYTKSKSSFKKAPPRNFDVHSFIGDPSRAQSLLGWRAEIPLDKGLRKYISQQKP